MRYFRDGILKKTIKKVLPGEMEVLFYVIILNHFMAR